MEAHPHPQPESVGIRELRQSLSVFVRRIKETGEELVVTEHGHPVAKLMPLRKHNILGVFANERGESLLGGRAKTRFTFWRLQTGV